MCNLHLPKTRRPRAFVDEVVFFFPGAVSLETGRVGGSQFVAPSGVGGGGAVDEGVHAVPVVLQGEGGLALRRARWEEGKEIARKSPGFLASHDSQQVSKQELRDSR